LFIGETAKLLVVDAKATEHFSTTYWAGSGLATGAYGYGSKDMI